jgi:hypothetical protein
MEAGGGQRLGAVGGLRHDLDARVGVENQRESGTDGSLIVSHHHGDLDVGSSTNDRGVALVSGQPLRAAGMRAHAGAPVGSPTGAELAAVNRDRSPMPSIPCPDA